MTLSEHPTDPAKDPAVGADDDGGRWFGLAGLVGLLGLLWVRAGWEFVVIVMALVVIIFLHELGHYIAAKRGGMKVTQFFLGFGPRVWSFHRGETEYGIKAIPAGAYVKVIGMNNLEEVDPRDEPRTYRQQSYPRRFAVAVAGSAMHFLLAFALGYALLVGWGVDRDETAWSIELVDQESPAQAAGLLAGDIITAIDGDELGDWSSVQDYIGARPNDEITLEVARGDEVVTLAAQLGAVDGRGRIGIAADVPFATEGPIEAIPGTIEFFGETAKGTFSALGNLVTPDGIGGVLGTSGGGDETTTAGGSSASDDEGRLISVVGFTQIGASAVQAGIPAVLYLLFIFNVFVGIFNLVPLLPLDGGHVVIATYERIREFGAQNKGRRYHADAAKMLPLAYAVVLFLLLIGGVTIVRDIVDPISV